MFSPKERFSAPLISTFAPSICGTASMFSVFVSLDISPLYSNISLLNSGSNVTFSIARFSRLAFAKSGLSVFVAFIV